MSEKICKIVYFDEDSVTDYIQIRLGVLAGEMRVALMCDKTHMRIFAIRRRLLSQSEIALPLRLTSFFIRHL